MSRRKETEIMGGNQLLYFHIIIIIFILKKQFIGGNKQK